MTVPSDATVESLSRVRKSPGALAGLDWRWMWRTINLVCVPLVLLYVWMHILPNQPTSDDLAYWSTRDGPLYDIAWNTRPEAYIYSPAFAQAIRPLTLLPFEVFHALLLVVQVFLLVWMVGPAIGAAFLFSSMGAWNVAPGNINVLLPALLVIEAWPVLLLTKVTPGVGVLWYPLRGEWRRFAWILGATAAIVAVSFALWPSAWFEWVGALGTATGSAVKGFPVPLLVRLPLAFLVVLWGARTDRKWALAPAAWLAMPDMAWSGAAWLLAVPTLRRRSGTVVRYNRPSSCSQYPSTDGFPMCPPRPG